MRRNYENKKYTSRVGKVDQKTLSNIRRRSLAHAKTPAEKKFILSSKFQKTINQNVRQNRVSQNTKIKSQLARELGINTENKAKLNKIYGERVVYRNGKKHIVNKFTSLTQTKRLKKALASAKKGTYNINRVLNKNTDYKDVKQYLNNPNNINEVLESMDRTSFYFENKPTIEIHNKNVEKHGVDKAETMKAGIKLFNEYNSDPTSLELEILSKL